MALADKKEQAFAAHISAAIVAGDKVDVLVVIILILRDPDKVLEFIHDSH